VQLFAHVRTRYRRRNRSAKQLDHALNHEKRMHLPRMTPWQRQALWAYVFLLPSLLFFLVIVVFPVFRSLQFSLHHWPLGAAEKTYLGLENYRILLFDDEIFRKSIYNTFRFTAGKVFFTLPLALFLALLLNQSLKGRTIFRTIYFIPVVSSLVAVAFIWRWLLEPSFGLVNVLLGFVSIKGPGWLASPAWALPGIMMMSIWRDVGFYMVIFLAGLQTIPRELYEAALVDGANAWQRFWGITLPLLNPTIVFSVVICVIYALQLFTEVFVMTGSASKVPGGPSFSTRPIVLHIYQAAFRSLEMGYASAAAFILFILILVFTIIHIKLIERPFDY
jgi:multiple sugar transport system permease protein